MKWIVLTFCLVLLPTFMSAQELPVGDPRNEQFREHFQGIVILNGDIPSFTTMAVGAEYQLPNGGKEVLRAGDTRGIWGREFEKTYGTPYEEFLATGHVEAQEPSVVTLPPVFATLPKVAETENSRFPWWLLVVAIAALVALWAISRLLLRRLADPVNSGPPVRQGGINDSTAPDYFREMASGRSGSIGSATYVSPERIWVVNILRGRGYGLMRVRYQGGREETKRLNGETVYQATVEFPDGRQETMYCLQGCANDLVYLGNRYLADRLFRFEPEGTSVYVPPQETLVRFGSTEVQITDEELSISSGGRTIAFGADNWTLRKGPDGGLVVEEEGRTAVEFRNGRIYGTELPKPEETDPDTAESDEQANMAPATTV